MDSAKKGLLGKRILIVVVILAILGFLAFRVNSIIGSRSAATSQNFQQSGFPGASGSRGSELTAVRVQAVEIRTVEELTALSGTLEPSYQVDIHSRRSGRVEQVDVHPGERVREGQVLGTVEHRDLLLQRRQMEANLAASQANLRRAEIQHDKAENDYQRVDTLFRQKAATEQELKNAANQLREAEVQLDLSQAQIEQGRANFEMLQLQLEQVQIDTPVDGVLLSSSLTVGMQLNTSSSVAKVAGIDPIEVVFYVPERDIRRLSPGQPFVLQIDAFPEQQFSGSVCALGTTVDSQTRSLEVRGSIPNPNLILRPGMYAKIELVVGKDEQVPAIPREALLTASDGFFVYLVKDDKVKQQPIQIGIQGREFVSVKQGLVPGDMVVTVGQQDLRDGQAVRPIGTDASSGRGGIQ